MYSSQFAFREIIIVIETDWIEYHSFINQYLANFIYEPAVRNVNLKIKSLFFNHSINSFEFEDSNKKRIKYGQDLYATDSVIYTHQSFWKIIVESISKEEVSVLCFDSQQDYRRSLKRKYDKVGFKKIIHSIFYFIKDLNRLLMKDLPKTYHLFQKHLRFSFHFPLFWLLESCFNTHLLHASAIVRSKNSDSGVIFCGMSGVGKSTLAAYFYFKFPDIDILTDNYLLYDSKYIYSFQEVSRIDSKGLDIISSKPTKETSFLLKDRTHWVAAKSKNKARIRKAFIISLGDELSVRSISIEQFIDAALSINDMAKEFHNYHYAGLFPLVNGYSGGLCESRYQVLKSCLHGVDCSLLTIPKTDCLETYHDRLFRIIGI